MRRRPHILPILDPNNPNQLAGAGLKWPGPSRRTEFFRNLSFIVQYVLFPLRIEYPLAFAESRFRAAYVPDLSKVFPAFSRHFPVLAAQMARESPAADPTDPRPREPSAPASAAPPPPPSTPESPPESKSDAPPPTATATPQLPSAPPAPTRSAVRQVFSPLAYAYRFARQTLSDAVQPLRTARSRAGFVLRLWFHAVFPKVKPRQLPGQKPKPTRPWLRRFRFLAYLGTVAVVIFCFPPARVFTNPCVGLTFGRQHFCYASRCWPLLRGSA